MFVSSNLNNKIRCTGRMLFPTEKENHTIYGKISRVLLFHLFVAVISKEKSIA
jgi:hypothetical protein